MKLTYFQIEAQLTKKLSPLYLICGEELLLKQDTINMIRKAAKAAGYNERVRLTPESAQDWEQLHTELNAGSLFVEQRLIEINCGDTAPPKAAASVLLDYIQNPVSTNILLLDMGKLDEKTLKSSWYPAFEKAGIVVTLWPIPREQLPQWIMQRAKKYKLSINPDAAQLLADYVEGNLIAAAQAIEKIYLLKPATVIDCEHIHPVLTDESRFTVFDFTDNLIAGNLKRSLHILEMLQADGTEPILVLWSITRELRLLSQLLQERQQGGTYESLFQKHRIFARRQTAIKHFLSTKTEAACLNNLAHAAQIDKTLKGGAPGNAWDLLQLFCLRLV